MAWDRSGVAQPRPGERRAHRRLAGEDPVHAAPSGAELAVGEVDRAPFLEQGSDLGFLPIQRVIDGAAAGLGVLELGVS